MTDFKTLVDQSAQQYVDSLQPQLISLVRSAVVLRLNMDLRDLMIAGAEVEDLPDAIAQTLTNCSDEIVAAIDHISRKKDAKDIQP